MPFNKGDVVEAVQGAYMLEVGKQYKVREYKANKWPQNGGGVGIEGIEGNFYATRFKLVVQKPEELVFAVGAQVKRIGEDTNLLKRGRKYTIETVYQDELGGVEYIKLNRKNARYHVRGFEVVANAPVGKPVVPLKPKAPPVPEDLREDLVQKQGTRGGLCSFAYEHPDGTRTFHTGAPCHARLDSYGSDGNKQRTKLAYNLPHQIYNLTHGGYARRTTEANHNFAAEWVINESPWAVAFLTKDINEAIEKGLFMDVEQNRNVIASSCCALRSFMEFERADVFRMIKEAGFTGGAAFLIACAFGPDGLGNYMRKGMGGGHDVIVNSQSFKGWIKFFKEGFHTACGTAKEPFRTHHGAYRMAAACADEGMESLYRWFEKNVKAHTTGEGWDKKQVINKDSLLEAAAQIDKLIKDEA